jgi:hypothetical protein
MHRPDRQRRTDYQQANASGDDLIEPPQARARAESAADRVHALPLAPQAIHGVSD